MARKATPADVRIICGLGNPGAKYEMTRHNVGFVAIDLLAEKLGLGRLTRTRCRAVCGTARVGDKTVLLMKPQTYMNLSGESVRDMLEAAGADRVLTMDLHANQIQGFFNIPVDNLLGTKILTQYFYDRLGVSNPDYVVVSPDLGSVTRVRKFTDKLDLPMAIVDKRRPKPNVSEVMNIIGDVRDKHVILVDDMVDTAGTLCNGAKALVERGGAKSVTACATHGVLSGPAIERLQASVIDKLVLLDTIPVEGEKAIDKIETLSVADLFAEAIRRIYDETAISDLYN